MTVDNITGSRGYPLPDPANLLDEDVLRLIDALNAIDADMGSVMAGLLSKAALVHGHLIVDVSGLQAALDGKLAVGATLAFSSLSGVSIGGATNGMFLRHDGTNWSPVSFDGAMVASGTIAAARLPSYLASTALSSTYAQLAHAHTIADVTGLQTALDGKAAASHTHTTTQVSGLDTALANKLERSGGTLTGWLDAADQEVRAPKLKDAAYTANQRGTISGAQTIDYALGNYVTAVIGGATTFTFANPPAANIAGGFLLILNNGGGAAITWLNVKWENGVAPTLTSGGIDLLSFMTDDGGATWRGVLVGKDVR